MIFMSGFGFIPQSNEQVGNYIVSASVSANGLVITCTMNESRDYIYPASEFVIHNGYVNITPMEAEQVGTTLTVTLDKSIRTGVNTTLDKITLSNNFDRIFSQPVTNGSTVDAPEAVTIEVSANGQEIRITLDENIDTHTWDKADYVINVNGDEISFVSDPYGNGNLIILDIEGVIVSTDTVLVSFVPESDPQLKAFTDVEVSNGSTVIYGESLPFTVLMTESLSQKNGFFVMHNSSSGATADGPKLRKPDGTAMTLEEATTRYPQDATVDLSGGYDGDIEWIPSIDSEWGVIFVDNVLMGVSCDVYALDYFEHDPVGNPGVFTLDIYKAHCNANASLNVDFPLLPNYSDVPFTPTESWKIKEETLSIVHVSEAVYTMDDVVEELQEVYVSFGTDLGPLPEGVSYINHFSNAAAAATPYPLLDKDRVDTGMTLTWDVDFTNLTSDYITSGDDSGFLYDAQQKRGVYHNCGAESSIPHTYTIAGIDPTETRTFGISGSSPNAGRVTRYTMNGNVTDVPMTDNVDLGATKAGVTGVTSFNIVVDRTPSDALMFVMGMKIIQTA